MVFEEYIIIYLEFHEFIIDSSIRVRHVQYFPFCYTVVVQA